MRSRACFDGLTRSRVLNSDVHRLAHARVRAGWRRRRVGRVALVVAGGVEPIVPEYNLLRVRVPDGVRAVDRAWRTVVNRNGGRHEAPRARREVQARPYVNRMIRLKAAVVGRRVAAVARGLDALAVAEAHHSVARRSRVLVNAEVVRVHDRAHRIAARHEVVDEGRARRMRGEQEGGEGDQRAERAAAAGKRDCHCGFRGRVRARGACERAGERRATRATRSERKAIEERLKGRRRPAHPRSR